MISAEEQVRAVTRAAAEIITMDSVPPLRLSAPPMRLRITPDRGRRTGWPTWAAPLAAATAVTAVVAGMSAVTVGRGPGSPPPGEGLVAGPPVTAYTSAGTIPAYYVALVSGVNRNVVPSHAVVRSTATGRVLATVPPPAHGTFVALTAGADDRTFVLAEQAWAGGNAETFYLLKLGRSGNVRALTRLASVPVLPQGSVVTGLALSPDGRKLAMAVQPGHTSQDVMQIRVYSLPGGAVRTWSMDGAIGASEDDPTAISWTDSRTLAFNVFATRNGPVNDSLRLLDTSSVGGSLLAHSRVVSLETGPLGCATEEIISPDGSVILCGAPPARAQPVSTSTFTQEPPAPTEQPGEPAPSSFSHPITRAFLEYSVATGKVAATVGVYQAQTADNFGLLWSDASGKVLIVAISSGNGTRAGVLKGQAFTPLPGTANLGAAVW